MKSGVAGRKCFEEDYMSKRPSWKLALGILALAIWMPGALYAADPVKVTWWNIGTAANDKALNQSIADAYMKAHPNVVIENTVLENEAFKSKLTTVMQSGNPPDLFQTWGGGVLGEYGRAGLLKDITKAVKGSDWYATQAPGVWENYSVDGKINAAAIPAVARNPIR